MRFIRVSVRSLAPAPPPADHPLGIMTVDPFFMVMVLRFYIWVSGRSLAPAAPPLKEDPKVTVLRFYIRVLGRSLAPKPPPRRLSASSRF